MVALLNPASGGNSNGTTATKTGNKVFKQDFKTIAGFSIGVGAPDANGDGQPDTGSFGGFANAYTTIPDMRTPELELGFSVNLTWRDGIEFNYEF